ncbi:MAG: hypothetical protein JNJ40_02770 [Bacteroidia bacterium]|nr:hypothetical protein [Bacteroidia bacterium]
MKTQYKCLLLLFTLLANFCFSQTNNFKTFLIANKFILIEVKYNAHSHTADIDAGYIHYPNNTYKPKLEMRTIMYDTIKAEYKRLLKNLKFKLKDTLLVYDWDPEFDPLPYNVSAARFSFNQTDSSLTFYNVQNISRNSKGSKPSAPIRKFKLIALKKTRFILLDLDYKDVKRTYTLKVVNAAKK